MILNQPGPVSNQSHDQMPPHPMMPGHRTDRHHLSVPDQPTGQPPGNAAFELGMVFHVPFPTMAAHEPPLGP